MTDKEMKRIQNKIICHYKKKYTMRKISSVWGVELSTVNSVIQKYKQHGTTERLIGSGVI